MAQDLFKFKSTGNHNGYRYSLLKRGGLGQDQYMAMAETLSIRTEPFATEKEAEDCIKNLIERTYQATFKKSESQAYKASKKSEAQHVKEQKK